jgi:hypothetical protein
MAQEDPQQPLHIPGYRTMLNHQQQTRPKLAPFLADICTAVLRHYA